MSRAIKIASAWTSIVYAVCFGGVALFPDIRPLFMKYALHTETSLGGNVLTLGTFISGLIIWNIIAVLAVALFVYLTNLFKE